MILLDTNVLIYGFDPKSPLQPWALGVIRDALPGDEAASNPVILTKLSTGDQSPATVGTRLEAIGVILLDPPSMAAPRCAEAYACYLTNRRQQPSPPAPKSPLPDFFIGTHGSLLGLPLATADLGRYRTYFPKIQLLTPP